MHILEKQQDLVNELLLFPRGKHDDLLDGLYYGNKGSYAPHHSSDDADAPLLTKVRRLVTADWQIA